MPVRKPARWRPPDQACVALLAYNAALPAERLNVADTVKVQWQAYLGEGALLLSDMGRVLLAFVQDTSGRHDALCGCSNRRNNDERYGDGGIWGASPNGRDLLALAGAKVGLDRRDVGPALNLFKGVRVGADGALSFDGSSAPGASVHLEAAMDVLVLLANAPHPLDDRATYSGSTARVTAWRPSGPPVAVSDTPERERAYQNTDAYVRTQR
jgi:urea carboxylase-associated protein 2